MESFKLNLPPSKSNRNNPPSFDLLVYFSILFSFAILSGDINRRLAETGRCKLIKPVWQHLNPLCRSLQDIKLKPNDVLDIDVSRAKDVDMTATFGNLQSILLRNIRWCL